MTPDALPRPARVRFCPGEVWRSPMGNLYRVLESTNGVVFLHPIEDGRGRSHRCRDTLCRGWTVVEQRPDWWDELQAAVPDRTARRFDAQ